MKIHVSAYQRSGTTWLVRLLSDLLDSPQSGREILEEVYWGNQGGNHTIIKTHWRLDEHNEQGKMIICQRDPRDVAVSTMYYRSLEPTNDNLMGVLETMTRTDSSDKHKGYHLRGWYQRWHEDWFESNKYDVLTRYELLNSIGELARIVQSLTGKILTPERIKESMKRQSFDNLKDKFPHSMRKGIVGDWKNHFKSQHCEYITNYLGNFMIEQGYIDSLEWW